MAGVGRLMTDQDPPPDSTKQEVAAMGALHKETSRSGDSAGKLWSFIKIFPWTLLLILICVFIELMAGKVRGTAIDYGMTVFAVLVLILEISKATDIRVTRFVTDLLVSVVGLILATYLLTYYIMVTEQPPAFYLWMVSGILLVDAILSPTISFATALRNMSVG